MNLHEVYSDLMGEMSKLDWKRDALLHKAVGVLKRSTDFPASVMYDYQILASKNQYIIYFYREHPFAPVLAGYLNVLFDGSKRYLDEFFPIINRYIFQVSRQVNVERCQSDHSYHQRMFEHGNVARHLLL